MGGGGRYGEGALIDWNGKNLKNIHKLGLIINGGGGGG